MFYKNQNNGILPAKLECCSNLKIKISFHWIPTLMSQALSVKSVCITYGKLLKYTQERPAYVIRTAYLLREISGQSIEQDHQRSTLLQWSDSRLGEGTIILFVLPSTVEFLRQTIHLYTDMFKYILGVWSNRRHPCRTGAWLLCYASTVQKHGDSHLQVVVACLQHVLSHAFAGTCNTKGKIKAFFRKRVDRQHWAQLTSTLSLSQH